MNTPNYATVVPMIVDIMIFQNNNSFILYIQQRE